MAHPDAKTAHPLETARRRVSPAAILERYPATVIGLVLGLLVFLGRFPVAFPFGNQNTYLLNGLAGAEYGHLAADWTANAETPFVVFTAIIRGLAEIGLLNGTYVLGGALICLFTVSCTLLYSHYQGEHGAHRGATALFALLLLAVALHDGFMMFMLRGMAGQYVLGMYLQPSEFGVLLMLSVALFVARKPLWPYVLAALAGVFHQSYLLVGAILVIGYASFDAFVERKLKVAAIGAGVALAIVAPVVWYSYASFVSVGVDIGGYSRSRHVLAEFRFAHHAVPSVWFDKVSSLKVIVMALSAALAWLVNRRLAFVMTLTAAIGGALSVLAVLSASPSFYLLFPWRVSVILMPLATVVMVAGVVRIAVESRLGKVLTGPRAGLVVAAIAVVLTAAAFSERLELMQVEEAGATAEDGIIQDLDADYRALVGHARTDAQAGQLYLHHPRRYYSFRIRSGLPTFVDRKSHPYRHDQVLEWWDRYLWADVILSGYRACDPALAGEMTARGITHVIVDKRRDGVDADRFARCLANGGVDPATAYDNRTYRVIRLD